MYSAFGSRGCIALAVCFIIVSCVRRDVLLKKSRNRNDESVEYAMSEYTL